MASWTERRMFGARRWRVRIYSRNYRSILGELVRSFLSTDTCHDLFGMNTSLLTWAWKAHSGISSVIQGRLRHMWAHAPVS
jgi:hypothetical protein